MALQLECNYGDLQCVKLLLRHSMDLLYVPNSDRRTPIEIACLFRHYDIVKYLLTVQSDGLKYILRERVSNILIIL